MIRVYHSSLPTTGDDEAPASFVAIAETETTSLEEARALTRHFGKRPWTTRRRVRVLTEGTVRSTSPGDVLELAGAFYLVLPVGFSLVSGLDDVTPTPVGRLRALALDRSASGPAPKPPELLGCSAIRKAIVRLLGFA